MITEIEQGTVPSQADSDWASFSSLQQVVISYDSIGRRKLASLTASGSTLSQMQYTYDNANRLTCTAVRMNASVFSSPPSSACSLGTTGSDGPDRITYNAYDAANEVTSVTGGYGTSAARTEWAATYNSNGTAATATDGDGNMTTDLYDGFDRLSKVEFPSPTTAGTSSTTDYEQYTYNAGSQTTSDRRRDGTTLSVAYDALGRATNGPNSAAYTYDNLGRLTVASLSGQSDTFAYDALGRVVAAAGPLGTLAYQYDLAGERTRVTWPDGLYIAYAYDLVGEVTGVEENGATSGAGLLATYSYDDLGRRTGISRGNGVSTSYSFDGESNLTSLVQTLTGSGQNQTFGFGYNAAGQSNSRTSANSLYDWNGSYAVSRSYSVNGRNQLTTSGSLSLTYDGRGNLTSDGVNTYTYDALNNLTNLSSGPTMSYDPLGRLYQTTGSATTRFGYDGANVIGEYNASNAMLRRYVYGPGADEPIVWYEGTGVADRRWMIADRLGSVIGVTNGSGTLLGSTPNTYDEYGIPDPSNQGRFQYTGQMWIPEFGLYHYKARAYSPTLGRFMQTDPIGYGDGMNWHLYANNDPVNLSDPTGLSFGYDEVWVKGINWEAGPGTDAGGNIPPPDSASGTASSPGASGSSGASTNVSSNSADSSQEIQVTASRLPSEFLGLVSVSRSAGSGSDAAGGGANVGSEVRITGRRLTNQFPFSFLPQSPILGVGANAVDPRDCDQACHEAHGTMKFKPPPPTEPARPLTPAEKAQDKKVFHAIGDTTLCVIGLAASETGAAVALAVTGCGWAAYDYSDQ